jgi:UDPglucose 6-dehydrogenase
MDIAAVGAGYVGLVTAACLAHVGHDVVCIDIDEERIARLHQGELPVHEPGLAELVAEGLAAGRLRFASQAAAMARRELVIVCVGTLDADEEWSGDIVRAAVLDIAADATLPRSIVIRSTLLPGTATGIAADVQSVDPSVRIAHNPEFTREASAVADFMSPDRVVIGVDGHERDERSAALVRALRRLYEAFDAPLVVTDLTSAEMVKVASNVFLSAKITFANEIARLAAAIGADAAAVVDGMGLDRRIGRAFLSPGPGFGGSCFPSQARALPRLGQAQGVQTPLMDAIWPSNASQAEWLVDGLERAAARSVVGMRVALLGLTFKAGTDDLRESPALRLGQVLLTRGAAVVAWDPLAGAAGVRALRAGVAAASGAPHGASVERAESPADACRRADAVVVATEWPELAALDWSDIAPTMAGDLVIDGRRVVDARAASAAGLRLLSLGVEVAGVETGGVEAAGARFAAAAAAHRAG